MPIFPVKRRDGPRPHSAGCVMIGALQGLRRVFKWPSATTQNPAICHVTHPEAGGEWIEGFLRALVPERIVEAETSRRRVVAGKVHPSLFLTREQFESAKLLAKCCRFVVIRDLRDTLVSLYFGSNLLSAVSKETGLLHLLEHALGRIAQMQWSWVAAREEFIRYEDMRERDEEVLAEVLLRRCRIGVDVWHFRETILANRFSTWAGCDEDDSPERPQMPGTWRRHFTGRVIDQFKKRYGSLLIATGHEKNFRW